MEPSLKIKIAEPPPPLPPSAPPPPPPTLTTKQSSPPLPNPIPSPSCSTSSTTTSSSSSLPQTTSVATTTPPKPILQQHRHPLETPASTSSSSSIILPNNDNNTIKRNELAIKDLMLFFENGQYNSCNATDELIRSIEKSQDEELAKKALDLYQKHLATLEKPWDHVVFMYGLGLVYMHFNAYNWAVKSFREAIYVQPSFPRSRDIHTRLGLIFKSTGRYKLSEKHFNLAINDTRPESGTSSKLELRFHLAHLYEIQGKLKQASDAYEKLLQEKDLPLSLSANIQRQLGWIYYRAGSRDSIVDAQQLNPASRSRKDNLFNQQNMLGQDPQKIEAALNYLNTSYRANNDSKTSYYLGRCLTNVGRFQDAFASYRSVIDRDESTADTWCSIGVLYHRQNQPWDALQAYIRSVQFDKRHSVAWMNLGLLYESHNQFRDALKCFQHAARSSSSGPDRSLQARIRYIQKQMADVEAASSSGNNNSKSKTNNNNNNNNNSDKLLNLEDMWNLESKTNSESHQPASNNKSTSKSIVPKGSAQTETKNNNNTLLYSPNNHQQSIITTSGEPRISPTLIDEQRKQHQLTNCSSGLNQKIETLNELSPNNRPSINNELDKTNNRTNNGDDLVNESKLQSNSIHHENKTITCTIADTTANPTPTIIQNGLPNHCKSEPNPQSNHLEDQQPQQQQQQQQIHLESKHPHLQDTKDFCLNQAYTNGASKDSGISSDSSTFTDCALVPSQNIDINAEMMSYQSAEQISEACKNLPRPRKYDINLLRDDDKPPVIFPQSPPYPPPSLDKLFPTAPTIYLETKKDLTTKKLHEFCQSSPISIVRNLATVLKLDLGLFSTKTLVESNPSQQIEIISHLSSYSHTNDGNNLSSSTTLENDSTDNMDSKDCMASSSSSSSTSWSCELQNSISTISRYASYQVSSFRESLREEKDNKTTNKQTNLTKESETDSNESALVNSNKKNYSQAANQSIELNHGSNSNQNSFLTSRSAGQPPPFKRMKKEQSPPSKVKLVRTANKIDISDEKRWRPQLNELNKLPYFIKCVSASNMLTHMGQAVPGVNTVVMNMHVPGCRFVGNDTPNNFCPIVINTGPGDYEWFAISGEYERILTRMCHRNGFELDDQGWWPGWSEFQKYNVPVYKFSQRPGDLVWVNSGTFYWVQAVGWTNSIQWNVGPLCARQYRLAAEKFEINKLLFKRSGVPMTQMTWNIVMNINIIADDELFKLIINVMRRSLKYCCYIRDLLEEDVKKEIIMLSDDDDEPGPRYARFCSLCDNEIFNITFKFREGKKGKKKKNKNKDDDDDNINTNNNNTNANNNTEDDSNDGVIYCLECARRADETLDNFDIMQDYDLTYLSKLYDGFIETKKRFQACQQQQQQLKLDQRHSHQQQQQQ